MKKKLFSVLCAGVLCCTALCAPVSSAESAYSLCDAGTTAYAEETQADSALPLEIEPDGSFCANTLFLTFKYDYTREQIESVLLPELTETIGKDIVKECKLKNALAVNGTVRLNYTLRLNVEHADQQIAYEAASKLYDTGYFYSIITHPSDKAKPMAETTPDDYDATALSGIFKYDYSREEIEEVMIPKLTELIGAEKIKEFQYIFTDATANRDYYNIYLTLDPADKQAAYEIAESLYETGYFYYIGMNHTDAAEGFTYQLGDANMDGTITMYDAYILMHESVRQLAYLPAELTEMQIALGDVNGLADEQGNRVTMQDAYIVMSYYCAYYLTKLDVGTMEDFVGNLAYYIPDQYMKQAEENAVRDAELLK